MTQQKRLIRILSVTDTLVDQIAALAPNAASPQELKQLTSALKELKDIQGLKDQLPTENQLKVVLEPAIAPYAN